MMIDRLRQEGGRLHQRIHQLEEPINPLLEPPHEPHGHKDREAKLPQQCYAVLERHDL
jgi:hypothetical protein